jgi:glycine cleavage system H lipoate-binding protein
MEPKEGGGHPVVPFETRRCVWMIAGVLSYQLCERPYDCDRCPLDAAMRAQFGRPVPAPRFEDDVAGVSTPDDASPNVVLAPPAAPDLRDDRLWSPAHFWVRPLADARDETFVACVGLEPGLASAMPPVHAMVMPREGQTVRAGQAHLWAIVEGGTFTLGAPLGGTVTRVNRTLADQPHLATTRPLEEGWLYEVEVATRAPSLVGLMQASSARREYGGAASRFREGLAASLRSATRGAPALPDGGEPLRRVVDMLGPEKYLAVLVKAYASAGVG